MISRTRIWWTFFWLGCTGFGGGIAVLSQIYTLIVVKKGWLSESEYWEAAALGQSLPGSPAANAICYIGFKLQKTIGAFLAVSAFILPSFFMMIGLTILYRKLPQTNNVSIILMGMNAAVVGIIFSVCIRIGRKAIKENIHWFVAAISCLSLITNFLTVVEVILLAGLLEILLHSFKSAKIEDRSASQEKIDISILFERSKTDETDVVHRANPDIDSQTPEANQKAKGTSNSAFFLPLGFATSVASLPILLQLVTLFLRVGAVTFGGGFVMIPLIEQEVVNNAHWLTHQEFVDGMALGQITPGPVIISATFIGYYVYGFFGALVATIAVFLPPFVLTVVFGHSLQKMKKNTQVKAFLDGVAPAVAGLMVTALIKVGQLSVHSWGTVLLALLAGISLLRWRLSPVTAIAGCVVLGYLLHYLFPVFMH